MGHLSLGTVLIIVAVSVSLSVIGVYAVCYLMDVREKLFETAASLKRIATSAERMVGVMERAEIAARATRKDGNTDGG